MSNRENRGLGWVKAEQGLGALAMGSRPSLIICAVLFTLESVATPCLESASSPWFKGAMPDSVLFVCDTAIEDRRGCSLRLALVASPTPLSTKHAPQVDIPLLLQLMRLLLLLLAQREFRSRSCVRAGRLGQDVCEKKSRACAPRRTCEERAPTWPTGPWHTCAFCNKSSEAFEDPAGGAGARHS